MTDARFLLQKLEILIPILILSPLLSFQATAARETMSLNGLWQFVKVDSLDSAPPGSGWSTIEVPGTVQGHNYERAWFRRSFNAPESWNGKRILLRFGGVKFDSRVFINDAKAGGCFNGYDAFDLDITDHVRFGAENDLLVGVHDWTALFAGDKLNLPAKADWTALRRIPRDRVLAPIGGRFDLYGIWDDVDLEAAPPVHVAGCFVRPSVARQRLTIDAAVANKTAAEFSGRIEARIYPFNDPGGAPVPASSEVSVEIPAAQVKTIRLEIENPGLKFWWPHEPNLYILELRVGDDVHRERFGWREFQAENGDFFLNGVKVHLLGRSWWPYDVPNTDEAITAKIKMLKENHVSFFRTHTQPWPRRWYELADEFGLMMMPEAAIFADDETYRIDDPEFWNLAQHAAQLLDFLQQGGNVFLHRPQPAEFEQIRTSLNLPLQMQVLRGPVSRAEGENPLIEALLREDLYWIEEQTANSQAAPKRAADMADALFMSAAANPSANPSLALASPPALVSIPIGKGRLVLNAVRWDEPGANALRAGRFASNLLAALGARFHVPAPVTVLEAEAMQPNPGIGAFTKAQDHVLMGANGYLEQPVNIAEPGPYRLGIYAKASAVDGVFSIVAVQLDGNELGRIECASPAWSAYELLALLPAGEHVFRFAFVNDARRPNEDRNLWLDRVEIAPGP